MTAPVTALRPETPIPHPAAPRYELAEWAAEFGVVAGVTGREADLSIARLEAESPSRDGSWGAFLQVMGDRFPTVVLGRQIHGSAVATHRDGVGKGIAVGGELDGHVTDRPGVLLGVTVADCVPVYLAAPGSGALALLHAGWRGIAAAILEEGVKRVCQLGRSDVPDMIMHCGVGICGACYEVDCDVIRAVGGGEVRPGSSRLDLREELARRARRLGIRHVTASCWCTAHDHDRFHSHRTQGAAAGRMLAYLGRPLT